VGESPRWHDGRLWFCHWGAGEVLAVDAEGAVEVVARVDTTIPFSIDWLPDGRLLILSGPERQLLGYADLGGLPGSVFNELGRFNGLGEEMRRRMAEHVQRIRIGRVAGGQELDPVAVGKR